MKKKDDSSLSLDDNESEDPSLCVSYPIDFKSVNVLEVVVEETEADKMKPSNMGSLDPERVEEDDHFGPRTEVLLFLMQEVLPSVDPDNICGSIQNAKRVLANDHLRPGFGENEHLVKSHSRPNDPPHLIKRFGSGRISCDNKCQNYVKRVFCGHAVAVALKEKAAEEYFATLKQLEDVPLTKIASTNIDSNISGPKVPKRKRFSLQKSPEKPKRATVSKISSAATTTFNAACFVHNTNRFASSEYPPGPFNQQPSPPVSVNNYQQQIQPQTNNSYGSEPFLLSLPAFPSTQSSGVHNSAFMQFTSYTSPMINHNPFPLLAANTQMPTIPRPIASSFTNCGQPTIASAFSKDVYHGQIKALGVGDFVMTLLRLCHGKVAACYGCLMPLKVGNTFPNSPYDLVAVTKTRKEWHKDGRAQMGDIGNVYCHFSCDPDPRNHWACVHRRIPNFDAQRMKLHEECIKHLHDDRKGVIVYTLGLFPWLVKA